MRLGLHPTRATMTAFEDGGLSPRRNGRIRAHLRGCARCRADLQARRAFRESVRDATRAPAPDLWASIAVRVEAGETVLLPDGIVDGGSSRGSRWRTAWVAGLALLVAASAAAAASGRGAALLSALFRPPPSDIAPVETHRGAGIDVPVTTAGLELAVRNAGPGVVVLARVADAPVLSVTDWASGGATRYRVGPGRVTVEGLRAGVLEVVVPSDAPGPVRIVVDARLVGVVQDGRVRFLGRDATREDSVSMRDLAGPPAGGVR